MGCQTLVFTRNGPGGPPTPSGRGEWHSVSTAAAATQAHSAPTDSCPQWSTIAPRPTCITLAVLRNKPGLVRILYRSVPTTE